MEKEKKWYTLKVQSNREKSITERLVSEMDREGQNIRTLVPTERVFFSKNGKKAHREKILYPGYIFVGTENLSILQDVIKNIPGATGLLKSKSGELSVLKENEIDRMLTEADKPKDDIDLYNFSVGEEVKVISGPFSEFKGTIISKDKSNKVCVSVPIFGRHTPIDLDLGQIEKIIF